MSIQEDNFNINGKFNLIPDQNDLVLLDSLKAKGHENVQSTHRSTIELTTENFLTLKGDCIIGINASKSCINLSEKLKTSIRFEEKILVALTCKDEKDFFWGFGSNKLNLTSKISMVFRKSEFISDRTILIKCTKAAKDLDKKLILNLKNPENTLEVCFYGLIKPRYIIKIEKEKGGKIVPLCRKLNILDSEYKINTIESNLFIPVCAERDKIINALAIVIKEFNPKIYSLENAPVKLFKRKNTKPKSLKELLKNEIPSELLNLLPRAYDIIGDIAIIELNREDQIPLNKWTNKIGEAILNTHKHIKTVFQKESIIDGDYRIRELGLIAGVNKSITEYRENYFRFKIDVKNVFFTPRLSFERKRLSEMEEPSSFIKEGILWDMFCGVGPFFIQIAKNNPRIKIFSTDINPKAVELAKQNVKLNKINNEIIIEQRDLRLLDSNNAPSFILKNVKRIIMNLPEKNVEFLKILTPFIHPNGTLLHIYQFSDSNNPLKHAVKTFKEAILNIPIRIIEILNVRKVKPYSPQLDTTVIDVIIKTI